MCRILKKNVLIDLFYFVPDNFQLAIFYPFLRGFVIVMRGPRNYENRQI